MFQKMKKCDLAGAPFMWGPCSAEHAEHMPKSGSECT